MTGIEISRLRSEFGRYEMKLDIKSSLSEVTKGAYDIVYTSHVLEHLTDLSTIFKQFYDSLKPKGILIIEVPNFEFRVKGNSILFIIGAVHPIGFCSNFFKTNLPEYGFSKIRFFQKYEQMLEPNYVNTTGCVGGQVIVCCTKE